MTKRKTPGERIRENFDGHWPYTVEQINRAIRRAQAKAWERARQELAGCRSDPYDNPYRGRARK